VSTSIRRRGHYHAPPVCRLAGKTKLTPKLILLVPSNRSLNKDLPDLRTIVESYQSTQIADRLASLQLVQDGLVRDGLVEDPVKSAIKRKIPDGFSLNRVEKTIEGVSAVNLLGVWVDKLARRRFDTASARRVLQPQVITRRWV